ncbi:MAG: carbon-nitrogen hydrolase family protein [Gammaproteobacteria bacterium]|nr:carbon-nitrogen hydrolase family protein [Gammaproteobacteria bacterium]
MASGSVIEANLQQAGHLISQACEAGAELVLLPENFAFFAKHDVEYSEVAEVFGEGIIQQFLKQQASEHQCFIVGGSIPLKANDPTKVRPSVLTFNPEGECIGRYDKMHLFDVHVPQSDEHYQESDYFEAGDETVVLDTPLGRLGLCVCYDLRFPEAFRLMLDKGVDIILVPSAFTKLTGQAHWETLVKARAIENLSYVVASNQGGFHVNGRETFGHSMIVDPWGKCLDIIKSGAGFIIADINLEQQKSIRQQFPVLQHRKIKCK